MLSRVNQPDIENPRVVGELDQYKQNLTQLKYKLNSFENELTSQCDDRWMLATAPLLLVGTIMMPMSAACVTNICHDVVMGVGATLVGGWLCIAAATVGYAFCRKTIASPTTFITDFKLNELNNILDCLGFPLNANKNINNAVTTICAAKKHITNHEDNPLPFIRHRISEALNKVGLFSIKNLVLEYCGLEEEKKSEQSGEKSRLLNFSNSR